LPSSIQNTLPRKQRERAVSVQIKWELIWLAASKENEEALQKHVAIETPPQHSPVVEAAQHSCPNSKGCRVNLKMLVEIANERSIALDVKDS
jgi:hypothetical protein